MKNRLNINNYSFIANKQEYIIYNCIVKYGFMEQSQLNIPILIQSIFDQIDPIKKDESLSIEIQSKTINNHLLSITGSDDSEAKSSTASNEQTDDGHYLTDMSTNHSGNRRLHKCVTYYLGNENAGNRVVNSSAIRFCYNSRFIVIMFDCIWA